MKVELYVHKYLGCLCAHTKDHGSSHDCLFWHDLDSLLLIRDKQAIWNAPKDWELIDEWEQ